MTTEQPLAGKVAVVAGASRGFGRAIAVALGQAGATVYATARSADGRPTVPWSGTIEDTAAEVAAQGGLGIPVRCDHTVAGDVEALFARIRREQGRVDVLVNNVWGGNELEHTELSDAPFWDQPGDRWAKMMGAGPQAHLESARRAVPLMLPQGRGLIVGTTFHSRRGLPGMLYHALAMETIHGLAEHMALDLRPHRIAAIALTPSWARTEREDDRMESTEAVGRAVAALAADADVLRWTGHLVAMDDLDAAYAVTAHDGRPHRRRSVPLH